MSKPIIKGGDYILTASKGSFIGLINGSQTLSQVFSDSDLEILKSILRSNYNGKGNYCTVKSLTVISYVSDSTPTTITIPELRIAYGFDLQYQQGYIELIMGRIMSFTRHDNKSYIRMTTARFRLNLVTDNVIFYVTNYLESEAEEHTS